MPQRKLALLFAVRQEVAPLARTLRPVPALPAIHDLPVLTGSLGDWEVYLVAGGVGHFRAGRAARLVLDTWEPDLIVMTGVAGALSPGLVPGDLLVADAVLTGGEVLVPSASLQTPPGLAVQTGPLLSLDRVLVTAAEKQATQQGAGKPGIQVCGYSGIQEPPHTHTPTHPPTHPPLAVEMETAPVARLAIQRGVPWAAVRAISDGDTESLPLDFNRLRNAEGDLPTARVALAALTHPGAIPGLIRLGRNTTAAAERLAEFWLAWLGNSGQWTVDSGQ